MLLKRSWPGLALLACTLALAQSGWVAAPLAKITTIQISQVKPQYAASPGYPTNMAANSFGGTTNCITDLFHKTNGNALDSQTIAATMQAK
jgi:hypothetical protein